MSSDLPSVTPERSFALRGLSQRDSLVFKSMVRLLAGKTRDRWICVEDDQADLLVVGHQARVQAARRADAIRPGTQVIRVEPAGRAARADALVLPLRADEVCLQLDRAGERIAAMPGDSVAVIFRLQLIRWPSALLLESDPQFLRLATVLGTRPTTMEELVERSNCPRWLCDSFASTMHSNGVARWILEPVIHILSPPAPDLAPLPENMPAGLFARIRARLNL